jgi:hypothetical protein
MYYSPILFSQIADLNLTQYHNCNIDIEFIEYLNSKEKILIYCLHLNAYLNVLEKYLDKIQKPFILISAMEDTQFPLEINYKFIEKIKSNIFFKHWFSINKTTPNDDKFTSIPYGLDYWTISKKSYFGENIQDYNQQNSVIENISVKSQHFSKRIPKIYGNFHFNFTDERYGGWRRKLLNIIPKDIIYYEKSCLKRSESYENMSKYSFVLSPLGHGLDCIRTFEALCLGCIVIMKKSCLDIIYEDLPILIVDEWNDINETLLNNTLIEFSNKKFNYEKLNMDYWIKLVNSRF